MLLKEKLFKLFKHPKYTPLTFEEIVKELKLGIQEEAELGVLIPQLLEEGKIAQVKLGRFVISKDADLVCGKIRFKANGGAFLIPEVEAGEKAAETIEILPGDTDVAIHDDRVLVRIKNERPRSKYLKGKRVGVKDDDKVYGRVKRVLKRRHETIAGTLQKATTYYYVIPDDPRMIHDVMVPHPKDSGLSPEPQVGEKVIVKLHKWDEPSLSPEGEIVKVLGPTHAPMVEYEALLHKYALSPEFPDAVMEEALKVPQKVSAAEIEERCDCRDLFTITIDPDDAKDFDDALSIEYYDNGEICVGIHIADVSSYVRSGSLVDNEARNRGNSTYLVGTVIPMLPHELSNGICSLVEGEDRLVKSVFVTFDKSGKIVHQEFGNSVINSSKRLTYRQAFAFLGETSFEDIKKMPAPPAHQTGFSGKPLHDLVQKELEDIRKAVRALWDIAFRLRKSRMTAGSLDFDIPEVKIFVDEEGHADRMEVVEYDESHQLIEEYMLLANQIVAKELFQANIPYISRVHDNPDMERLNELRDTLLTFDIETGDLSNRKSVIKLLGQIKTHPQGHILKVLFLRSLKQACYRAEADGHYGLYMTYYAHFTSPIRRYSDLIVHRIFDNYLLKYGYETAIKSLRKNYSKLELVNLAQHLSVTEQNSTEAERESVKIKLLEYFERENAKTVKTKFRAIITDVKNHGIFIELSESLAFGLVHMSTLKDDMFYLNNEKTALVGRKTGRQYWIGQTVEVIIDRVDRFKRQMDFKLTDTQIEQAHPPLINKIKEGKTNKAKGNGSSGGKDKAGSGGRSNKNRSRRRSGKKKAKE